MILAWAQTRAVKSLHTDQYGNECIIRLDCVTEIQRLSLNQLFRNLDTGENA